MKKCFLFPHKKRYGTEQAARAMIALRQEDGPRLRSYFCKSCRGWHLSSVKEN